MMLGGAYSALLMLAGVVDRNPSSDCLVAIAPLERNSVPANAQFAPIRCPDKHMKKAFRFDVGTGTPRALRKIAPGAIIRRWPFHSAGGIRAGDGVFLVSSAGLVTLRREVTALQSGMPGQRVFVRDAEGNVFAATYMAAARR